MCLISCGGKYIVERFVSIANVKKKKSWYKRSFIKIVKFREVSNVYNGNLLFVYFRFVLYFFKMFCIGIGRIYFRE